MRRFISVSVLALVLGALVVARQAPQSPIFRAGVELIDLDVSVLDQDRRAVLGLTAADFTVLVDGQPRPIVAFKAVELPARSESAAPWARDIAPDIATNTAPTGRVVVIMMDDGSLHQADTTQAPDERKPVVDLWGIGKMRQVAHAVVDDLGPEDLAAVVFTENNHTAASFTFDRRRLLTAIDSSVLLPGPALAFKPPQSATDGDLSRLADPFGLQRGSCLCGLCSIAALDHVAESLRSLPHQRKVIVYVSAGIVVHTIGDGCSVQQREAMSRVFRTAALANVSIHPIDPKGLATGPTGYDMFGNPKPLLARLNFLRSMAENTGGRAVVENNDMEREVPSVLAESNSYYLLGVEQPGVKDDGKFHEFKVRVNRPDVEVRTRKGFYALTEKERAAMTATAGARDLTTSIGAALPKSDIPMDVGVTPLEGPDGKSAVALVVAVRPPIAEASVARTESIELMTSAFNLETGDRVTSQGQKVDVVWNATDAASGVYEVISRMLLQPGRYELRLGLKGGDGRTASVYGYADVPNFGHDALAVSGLMLSSTPRPKVGTVGDLAASLPILPTARRKFSWKDEVTVWLRVYEPKGKTFVPVSVTTKITDSTNQVIDTTTETLTPPPAPGANSVDYKFPVSLTALPPGEFLLTVDVTAGASTAQRFLRFTVE